MGLIASDSDMKLYGKILVASALAVLGYATISPARPPSDEMQAYVKEANDNAAAGVNRDGLKVSYSVPDRTGTLVVICTVEDVCEDAYRGFAGEDSLIEDTYRAAIVGLPGAKDRPSVSAVAWKAGFRTVEFDLAFDDGWKTGFKILKRLSLHDQEGE
jgi:hypothetical protein